MLQELQIPGDVYVRDRACVGLLVLGSSGCSRRIGGWWYTRPLWRNGAILMENPCVFGEGRVVRNEVVDCRWV